jgi:hypothetical protein
MTYDRVRLPRYKDAFDGAIVSHPAELVRGHFLHESEGPLIRPFGGEGYPRRSAASPITA